MPNFIDLIKAVFLGVVEGLTEFIPVSSTAHLLISSYLIDFQAIKNDVFEIVIQLGAILAICVLYRKKLIEVALHLKEKNQQKFVLNLILSFLPAAIIGVLFHDLIKSIFFSNFVIAWALILGGLAMIFVEKKFQKTSIFNEVDELKPLTAFKIGCFQCIAMIPGVSRSGATIIGGILLGLSRKTAAEFSFFLAIPTIAAASLFDLIKNSQQLTQSVSWLILLGLISAFVSAILVIKWFINFVSKNSFIPFAIYRILVGILILIFIV